PTAIYTLSLHDALPISPSRRRFGGSRRSTRSTTTTGGATSTRRRRCSTGRSHASCYGSWRSVRILVAEDETIIRLDLRDMLQRAGYDVCAEARDGEEAVELARAERPDLAIMDVKR